MHVAFIGLGVMGFPMAGHLQTAGCEVTVYNRSATRATQWVERYGGKFAETPAQSARNADIVFTCVGNDDDVRSVVLGASGVLAGMQPGAVLVDHTTASAKLARELERVAESRQLGFLDAPVSGGQAGAENGKLTVMVGGSVAAFDKASPTIEHYAQCVRHLGPAGNGQLAKMANQVCIAGVVQGLAEAMQFADLAGLDVAQVIEVISRGAAQSWQMENRYKTMLADEYDHGFAVNWMRKDLSMALEEAEGMGLDMELTRLVDGFYAEIQTMGGGRWDTSSLLARLKKNV
jgi:3-hydroxyisobutyrate dehydrogenase-like beta-hydroxyacid dehydrogenase